MLDVRDDVLGVLTQLRVDVLPELAPHHDVDDARRDRDGGRDCKRGGKRQSEPERHGSRST